MAALNVHRRFLLENHRREIALPPAWFRLLLDARSAGRLHAVDMSAATAVIRRR